MGSGSASVTAYDSYCTSQRQVPNFWPLAPGPPRTKPVRPAPVASAQVLSAFDCVSFSNRSLLVAGSVLGSDDARQLLTNAQSPGPEPADVVHAGACLRGGAGSMRVWGRLGPTPLLGSACLCACFHDGVLFGRGMGLNGPGVKHVVESVGCGTSPAPLHLLHLHPEPLSLSLLTLSF